MNVSTLMPQSAPKDFASLQAKTECYQRVWRVWGVSLTIHEQLVALVLIDRTIGWGRREAYFTNRTLLEGDTVYPGLPMGRTKLFEALASLEQRGAIRRRKDPRVPDRIHYTVNMDWTPDVALKLPKRLRDPVRVADRPVRNTDYSVREADPIRNCNPLTVSTSSNQPGASAPVSLNPADIVREKENVSRAANRTPLSRKATGPQAAVDAVDAAWRLALTDTFPGTAYRTWGVREKAQVKLVLKNWRGDITFLEFIDWAVRNWTAIMRKQFKWMTRETPPAVPVLSFFIAFLTQFADCRAEGKLEEWLSDLDRTQLERMTGRGMTYEEATAELGKAKAAIALRSEMELREIKVRARERGADAKLKQAEALAEFEGRAPIHPRSRAAEALRRAAEKPTRIIPLSGEDEFAPLSVPMVDMKLNPFD